MTKRLRRAPPSVARREARHIFSGCSGGCAAPRSDRLPAEQRVKNHEAQQILPPVQQVAAPRSARTELNSAFKTTRRNTFYMPFSSLGRGDPEAAPRPAQMTGPPGSRLPAEQRVNNHEAQQLLPAPRPALAC